MPTIKELQDEIIEDFAALDDWMDRYALLIDLGGERAPRPEDIINSELYFIKEIGLSEHLSPTRSNGLVAMLRQMRLFAATFAAQG